MKKLKIFGAAVMAASLLFTSCAPAENPTDPEIVNPDPDPTPDPDPDPNPDPNPDPTPDPDPKPVENGEFTITFSDANNTVTYKDGVYTVSVANANDSEWGNQIFIANPNKAAGVAAGDKIHTSITLEADKEITTMFVKNQFNGVLYSGIDTQKNLPANEVTVFDIYGIVADNYDETSSIVLALRGNAADTILKISEVKVEKLTDYTVNKVEIKTSTTTISAGETVKLSAFDQYGFEIEDAVFEITSENPVSTISGNVLTGGNAAETITVVAKSGDIVSEAISIIVSVSKDYAKYWNPTTTTEGANPPADYFSIWADQNWCGSNVVLSDMTATETSVSLTQTVTGACWFGTQIWYGLSKTSNLSFKVTSSVAGAITVNDVVYTLEADTAKAITLENVSGKLAIQLGQHAEGETSLGSCTFTISDFTVTAAE